MLPSGIYDLQSDKWGTNISGEYTDHFQCRGEPSYKSGRLHGEREEVANQSHGMRAISLGRLQLLQQKRNEARTKKEQ